MDDELNLNEATPVVPQEPNIADKATTDLSRGRILLEAQINKLMTSLDRRKNQTFDPVMLRMAQGFLAPTKTGRFSESISNVAGGVAEEQAKQQAYNEQTDKLKLELQQKMYEMQSDAAGSDMMRQAITGGLGPKAQQVAQIPSGGMSAPVGGVQPTSIQGEPVKPQATQAVTPQQALQVAVTNPSALEKITMTPDMVQMFYSLPGGAGKKYGEMADKIFNNQRQMAELNIKESELANKTREINTKQVPVRSPYDRDSEMQMSTTDYNKYLQLDFNDNKAVNTFLRTHGLGAYAIGAEGAPTGGTGGGSGVTGGKTKLEAETEAKIKEKREGSKIDEDKAERTAISAAAKGSMEVANNARASYNFAANPKTSTSFGMFSKPGIKSAILSAIEEGVRVGPYNIGVSNLQDTVRKAGGTQADIDTAAAVAQNIAQLQVAFRKQFEGQGSVSDREDALSQRTLPTLNDSPKIVMLKSEILMARAKFDETNSDMYQSWAEKNPNGYVAQYKQSPGYKQLVKQYDNKLEQVEKKYMPK